jgi:hypothetical protein
MTIQDVPDLAAAEARPADGVLLEFLAPGIVHALGNHLFAIQGCAHVLRDGTVARRERTTILEAATQAEHALDVLRLLAADPLTGPRSEQPGVLLARLAPLCRVPLRDRGLQLVLDHSSSRRPRVVEARSFTRAVVDLLLRISGALPAFVEGSVFLDLADQVDGSILLEIAIEFAPSCLPFPMDKARLAAAFSRAHDALGIAAELDADGGLRIRIPTVR